MRAQVITALHIFSFKDTVEQKKPILQAGLCPLDLSLSGLTLYTLNILICLGVYFNDIARFNEWRNLYLGTGF